MPNMSLFTPEPIPKKVSLFLHSIHAKLTNNFNQNPYPARVLGVYKITQHCTYQ